MPKDKVKNKDLIVGFRWRSMRDYFTITGFASLLDVKYVCVSSALEGDILFRFDKLKAKVRKDKKRTRKVCGKINTAISVSPDSGKNKLYLK